MSIHSFFIGHNTLDGTTQAKAAKSALAIKNTTGTTTNGYYWIKPNDNIAAQQVHCDMTNNGGGWMLMSFCGINVTNGAHVEDAQYGYPFNMGSTSTSLTSTNQSSGTAGNMGQSFIDALVQNGRSSAVACFRIEDSGTTWKNWYFAADSNARWFTIAGGRNGNGSGTSSNSTNAALSGNTWLRTCYPTYTANSGNNGAGSVSGTSTGCSDHGWGLFPYNLYGGGTLVDNWGYSISPTYNNSTQGYATYVSCHSNGWNRRGSFWLKSV